MKQILLNDKLSLTYPDGFDTPSLEEIEKLQFLNKGPGEILSDPERHLLATAAYRTISGLQAMLLNINDIGKKDAKLIADAMAKYSCRMGEVQSTTVAGEKAISYSYHYTAEDVEMFGESIEMKNGKDIYYLHFYGRAENEEKVRGLIEEVIASAAFR